MATNGQELVLKGGVDNPAQLSDLIAEELSKPSPDKSLLRRAMAISVEAMFKRAALDPEPNYQSVRDMATARQKQFELLTVEDRSGSTGAAGGWDDLLDVSPPPKPAEVVDRLVMVEAKRLEEGKAPGKGREALKRTYGTSPEDAVLVRKAVLEGRATDEIASTLGVSRKFVDRVRLDVFKAGE